MTNAELREFCTQMIGKFKLLSDIQKEMQYETIDAKFTEWELKKLIFALNVLREEVRKYVDTADTPQTETQTETQNSNLTFEKDECAKEYEELGLKKLKELIEADRKTEPTQNQHIQSVESVGEDRKTEQTEREGE